MQVGQLRDCPAPIFMDHADGTVDKVAETVGEVFVVAADEPFGGVVRVSDPSDVPHQPPAQGIGAVLVHDRDRVDRIAKRLGRASYLNGRNSRARRSCWAVS